MDILKDHALLTKVKLSRESQLETITATNDKSTQTKAKLKKEIVELKLDIRTKMDEYWSLWTQLLDDSLKEKWEEIVTSRWTMRRVAWQLVGLVLPKSTERQFPR